MELITQALKYLARNSKSPNDIIKYTAAYNTVKEYDVDEETDLDISNLLIEFIKQNLPEDSKQRQDLQRVVSYIGSKNEDNPDNLSE